MFVFVLEHNPLTDLPQIWIGELRRNMGKMFLACFKIPSWVSVLLKENIVSSAAVFPS